MPSTPMNELRFSTSGSCRIASASCLLQRRHGVVGDALRGFRDPLDHAGILHREEALRDQDIEHDGERERQHGDEQRQRLVVQDPVQRVAVVVDHGVEGALGA